MDDGRVTLYTRPGFDWTMQAASEPEWNHKTARAVRAALAPLARSTSPLSKSIKKKDTTWVEPRYNAEIMYADITDDGMVRHPSFKRLVP